MRGQKKAHTDLIDSLLAECKKPGDLIGEHGLLIQLSQALAERTAHVANDHAAILPNRKFDHD